MRLVQRLKRLLFFLALIIFVMIIAIFLRLNAVKKEIANAPIIITDLSESGYTAPGIYGHGNLKIENPDETKALPFWIIYDQPHPSGKVQKICAQILPENKGVDIDFFFWNGNWFKIRSGQVTLSEDGWIGNPEKHKWRGFISSKLVFDVRHPDMPYRLKILSDKIRYASLSPLEYVERLKQINPECTDIPNP